MRVGVSWWHFFGADGTELVKNLPPLKLMSPLSPNVEGWFKCHMCVHALLSNQDTQTNSEIVYSGTLYPIRNSVLLK